MTDNGWQWRFIIASALWKDTFKMNLNTSLSYKQEKVIKHNSLDTRQKYCEYKYFKITYFEIVNS